MKKLLLVLLALPLIGFGQTAEAGKFYIAMGSTPNMYLGRSWISDIRIEGVDSITLTSQNWNENYKYKTSNFNIQSQLGYFIIDGLVTGLGISYSNIKSITEIVYDFDDDGNNDISTSKTNYFNLSLKPFLKYYIGIGSNALFLQTSYGFSPIYKYIIKSEIDYTSGINSANEYDYNLKITSLNFETGMAFFLTESIALEPSINYDILMTTEEQELSVVNNASSYDLQVKKEIRNSIYFNIAASMYF